MTLISILITMMMIFTPVNDKALTELTVKSISDSYPTWTQEYEEGVFDCSEMSAYVSRCLDVVGVENKIVIGHSTDRKVWHAWVEADDYTIECTKLILYSKTGESPIYYQNYFRRLYTEYEAYPASLAPTESDWWNSPIFNK